MKIINDGVPEIVFAWLSQEFYDTEAAAGTISASRFCCGTRELILTERYNDKIEIPASSRLWLVLGSGVHAAMEGLKLPGMVQEKRLFAEVLIEDGTKVVVSGKPDIIYSNQVHDFKTTSAWSYVYGSREDEWKVQLSIYKWLHYKNTGETLDNKGIIIAIFRDWQESQYLKNRHKYPKSAMLEMPIQLMSMPDIYHLMIGKLDDLSKQSTWADKKLELCSDHERWGDAKCKKYCVCREFCDYAKSLKED